MYLFYVSPVRTNFAPLNKLTDILFLALTEYFHASVGYISYPSGKLILVGLFLRIVPVVDTLDNTFYRHMYSFHRQEAPQLPVNMDLYALKTGMLK